MRRIPRLTPLLLAAIILPAAEDCRECHLREANEWFNSAHAQSLRPVKESGFYKALPDRPIGESRGGFLLNFADRDDGVSVTAERGAESAGALITWVFGAGRRAETPLAAAGTRQIELRISYYAAPGKFDLTLGHAPGISRSARDALGIVQSPDSVRRCFGCHSTGGLAGVGCPACHAAPHRAEAKTREAGTIMALCGTCHRSDPEGSPDDLINIRYQLVRLKRSRCFASGRLSCLTCHDPHANARSDAAWYRGRCLECHPQQNTMRDCLECHMPRMALNPRLMFTDHWIRVRL